MYHARESGQKSCGARKPQLLARTLDRKIPANRVDDLCYVVLLLALFRALEAKNVEVLERLVVAWPPPLSPLVVVIVTSLEKLSYAIIRTLLPLGSRERKK